MDNLLLELDKDKLDAWFGLEALSSSGNIVFHIMGTEDQKQQSYIARPKDADKVIEIANALLDWGNGCKLRGF